MKVFNTKSSEILENCKLAFEFRPFSLSVAIKKRHFYKKNATTDNALCQAITAFTLSSDYVANEAVIAKHYSMLLIIMLFSVFNDICHL